MYEIIISIRKKWWDLIKSGEKTLELRKTIPKKAIADNLYKGKSEPFRDSWEYELKKAFVCLVYVPEEKAICGRFLCPGIEQIGEQSVYDKSRVPYKEQNRYKRQGRGLLFGWKVGIVEEFKEKKPLSAYGLNRPPQSWQYFNFSMW